MHEKQLHEYAWFLTLSYSDVNLPPGMSLRKRDVQLFLKRLRKTGARCRYLYCGEYGETTGRPHYHMVLYGPALPDLRVIKRSAEGYDLYESGQLTKLWGLGHVWVGAVTFESAAYVARYVTKKVTGDGAEEHYRYVDPASGEIFDRLPEFINMSTRPGIGKGWYEKFGSEVARSDSVVVRGKESKPPRYYDKELEKANPRKFRAIKSARVRAATKAAGDNTPDRLSVKEVVRSASINQLKRDQL